MPKITHVDTMPYRLPLHAPLKWGAGHEMHTLEHLLIRVQLDDGAVGLAEINPRPTIYGETPASATAIIHDYIAPALVGGTLETPNDINALTDTYRLLKNNHSAQAGADVALWDAMAASQGTTVSALLGGVHPQMRVSYLLGMNTPDETLAEVETVYQTGVRVLKIKVGRDFEQEAELIRIIRDTYPDMDYYLDANETFSVDDAPALLRAYSELGVWYCEEPLPIHLLHQRAELRNISPVMLVGDDSCFTARDVERELAFNTFDVLNIKPARTGFTQSLHMARQVRRTEKYVMAGSQASSILGCLHTLMFATLNSVTEPSEATYWMQVDDDDALPIENGYISLEAIHSTYQTVKTRLLASWET